MTRQLAAFALTVGWLLLPFSLAAETEDTLSEQERQERLEKLEKRVEELEATDEAGDSATRSIISQALSDLGSNINNIVAFGGTLEVLSGWTEDFDRTDESLIRINTIELDFEVRPSDWVLGSVILEYDDGLNNTFTTTEEADVNVDRLNVDTAFVKVGNTERFWPYAQFGRVVVPFGISTGDPVADVLTLEDPLTVEVFETKADVLMLGFEFPTPPLTPEAVIPSPPKVEPKVVAPLIRELARILGYKPLPAQPPRQTYITPPSALPPFTGAFYFYDGQTQATDGGSGWNVGKHWGASLGYRTRGSCSVPLCVPWSFQADVDYNHSIFETSFLRSEYRSFLKPIGFEGGMSASTRTSFGPFALVVEWNGALKDATFFDDQNKRVRMRPTAWQASLAYQFGWNRWVEVIGAQGTYVTVGYSESNDLQGVIHLINGLPTRVGSVPERRFLVGVGEWVTPFLRLAVEYARVDDYGKKKGGTGNSADGVLAMLTFEW